MIVTIAAAGCLATLAYLTKASDGEIAPPVIFERRSTHAQVEVSDCIERTMSSAFADLQPVTTIRPSTIYLYQAYVAQDGTTLSIDQIGAGSAIRFASARGLTGEQRDVLEWCAATPETTWIPRAIR